MTRPFQPTALEDERAAAPGTATAVTQDRALAVPLPEAARRLGGDPSTWRAAARLFPVRWPAGYLALAEGPGGEPVRRMGMPDASELAPQPGELADPVGESHLAPVPFVVRKHPDRVILLVTAACHFYCRFCFRRSFPDGGHAGPTRGQLAEAIDHLRGLPDLREVILSGGDPLTLSDERLVAVLAECAAIPQVTRLRIHSRAPVHEPSRVTPRLAQGLVAAAAGKPLRLVTHPNATVELTPAFRRAVGALQGEGIEVLSQSVLLGGVNDDAESLARLFDDIAGCGVTPYYLHHPDRVRGAARFFVPIARGLTLVREARTLVRVATAPSYVLDVPDGSGKVPVESLVPLGGSRFRAPNGFEWEDVRG